MGHRNQKTLVDQVVEVFNSKLVIGQSKFLAKLKGEDGDKIYGWGTYHTYLPNACRFVKWCHEKYGCSTLEECRPYAAEWLDTCMNLSPCTIYTYACSIAKLYGCDIHAFMDSYPVRYRYKITRSRGKAIRDAHFSEANHAELIAFCRATGLRRGELKSLRGNCLVRDNDGRLCINVVSGAKGGRHRLAPIVGGADAETLVTRLMKEAGNGIVFQVIPNGADIHSYRSDYATAIYRAHARTYEECLRDPFYNPLHYNGPGKTKGAWEQNCVYMCRKDRAGEWLDKKAMLAASKALGHNRISVVAAHYIR